MSSAVLDVRDAVGLSRTCLSLPKTTFVCSVVISLHMAVLLPSLLKASCLDVCTSYGDREGREHERPGLADGGLAALFALGPPRPEE